MTDSEIMQRAFLKQFPPETVVLEAIRLARKDERANLNPERICQEERDRLATLLDEVKGRLKMAPMAKDEPQTCGECGHSREAHPALKCSIVLSNNQTCDCKCWSSSR